MSTVHVSLQDANVDPTEAQAIRDWMMADEPAADEAPVDWPHEPTEEDERWWAAETRQDTAIRLLDFRHIAPGRSVALVEREQPRGLDFRYMVIAYADGAQVDFVETDSLSTAQMVFQYTVKLRPTKAPPA